MDGSRAWLAGALVGAATLFVLSGCLAGPQPEPPYVPEAGGAGRSDGSDASAWRDDSHNADAGFVADGGGAPPVPPGAGSDASPADPAQTPGPWWNGEADGTASGGGGSVAPFPFGPCCRWFRLPDLDAGADAAADEADTAVDSR